MPASLPTAPVCGASIAEEIGGDGVDSARVNVSAYAHALSPIVGPFARPEQFLPCILVLHRLEMLLVAASRPPFCVRTGWEDDDCPTEVPATIMQGA